MHQNIYTQIVQGYQQIEDFKSVLAIKSSEFYNQISLYKLQRNYMHRQIWEPDANGEIIINTPVDGSVASLSVTEGQMVNTGDSLAQLITRDNPSSYIVMFFQATAFHILTKGILSI